MFLKFQLLLKNQKQQSSLNFEKDTFTNYKYEDFKSIEECIDKRKYSYYCYTLCRWGISSYYYLLRISDIDIIDGVNFIFVCPAYKITDEVEIEMAKRKSVLTEPNKLGLIPGKLSIDIDDLPVLKLDNTNSYYDPKKKKRVPILPEINKEKQITPKSIKTKIEDEMVNNTDIQVPGKLHSSHFLPPVICTRLWVLNRGSKSGWGWYLKTIDGFKNKYEYYCRPIELSDGEEQYNRGGDMFTYAFLKVEFPELDAPELCQEQFIKLSKTFMEKQLDSIQVAIDALIIRSSGGCR